MKVRIICGSYGYRTKYGVKPVMLGETCEVDGMEAGRLVGLGIAEIVDAPASQSAAAPAQAAAEQEYNDTPAEENATEKPAAAHLVPEDLADRLKEGKLNLWVAMEDGEVPFATITTSIYETRSGKTLRIHCCGGDRLYVWKHLMSDLEKYAKAEGCVKIVAEARQGWLRVLEGFEQTRIVIEKRL